VADINWQILINDLVKSGTSHYKIGLCVCGKITPAARTRKVKRWAAGVSVPSYAEGELLLELVADAPRRHGAITTPSHTLNES
jgi:hypothetical protein